MSVYKAINNSNKKYSPSLCVFWFIFSLFKIKYKKKKEEEEEEKVAR